MNWVQVGKGRLSVRGRPGRKFWETVDQAGVTRLVTLLSSREGGQDIGTQAEEAGINWTWIPLENASQAVLMASSDLWTQLPVLATSLAEGESVMIHCAAGIHRTGMVAYALLRLNGYEPEASFEALADMRVVTREGVGQERLSWVEQLIHDLSD